MKAIVGETIKLVDYTPEVQKWFESELTFSNPEYIKRLNSGRWIGNTPEYIRLYQRCRNNLIIPFGMLPTVFRKRAAFEEIQSEFSPFTEKIDYASTIKPYDYQEAAIRAALEKRQGVIVAPCGAGKTQIGLEIAARIGGRTLWLTHTQELLSQSMERAKAVYGLKGSDYGTITAGKVDIGNVITFATVQTLSRIDLRSVRDCWDVVIVDEAHHAVGTPTKLMMFWQVVSNLRARYKYGLTATPNRSDGLTPCMYALIGPKCYEITRGDVEETTCPVKVKIRQTDYTPDLAEVLMPDGTLNYPKFITEILRDKDRNELIVKDILEAKGKSLVLTDRVEHIETLGNMLREHGARISGLCAAQTKDAKAERKAAVQRLVDGDIDILIATFSLAREGLDIPALDNVFFASPQKNEAVVTQAAGRVARKAAGKEFGTVYDYEDAFSVLKSWQNKRVRIYHKLNFS